MKRKFVVLMFISFMLLSGCIAFNDVFAPEPSPTLTSTLAVRPSQTNTPTMTSTATSTATLTSSPTATTTPTETQRPTITPTYTITSTATFEYPSVEVNVQAAHCRYGPAKAYLHAADLYEGDRGLVQGRFQYSNWLYVKWDKLAYRCWVSPFVVDVSGDVSKINYHRIGLERIPSTLYEPPNNVRATREGDSITITWDRVPMTEDDDRGYLIEAFVCQDGFYLWWPASFENQYSTSYTVQDETGCAFESKGEIYTVEKHGYTDPVPIPWPSQ